MIYCVNVDVRITVNLNDDFFFFFQLNASVQQLQQCVVDLTNLYSTHGVSVHRTTSQESDQNSEHSVFLSQLPLNHFTEAEEKFTQELTKYTKRLFFQVKF